MQDGTARVRSPRPPPRPSRKASAARLTPGMRTRMRWIFALVLLLAGPLSALAGDVIVAVKSSPAGALVADAMSSPSRRPAFGADPLSLGLSDGAEEHPVRAVRPDCPGWCGRGVPPPPNLDKVRHHRSIRSRRPRPSELKLYGQEDTYLGGPLRQARRGRTGLQHPRQHAESLHRGRRNALRRQDRRPGAGGASRRPGGHADCQHLAALPARARISCGPGDPGPTAGLGASTWWPTCGHRLCGIRCTEARLPRVRNIDLNGRNYAGTSAQGLVLVAYRSSILAVAAILASLTTPASGAGRAGYPVRRHHSWSRRPARRLGRRRAVVHAGRLRQVALWRRGEQWRSRQALQVANAALEWTPRLEAWT